MKVYMKINSYRETPFANVHFLNSCILCLGSSKQKNLKNVVLPFSSINFLYVIWLVTLFYWQHPSSMWITFFSEVPIICAVSKFQFFALFRYFPTLCAVFLVSGSLYAVSLVSDSRRCFSIFRLSALYLLVAD
jgi:hypothetical protein